MSSLNRVRLDDGTEVSISEWLHQPVWSTCEFAQASAINLRLFNYVRGQVVSHVGTAARNADERDTNVVRRSKVNQDEAHVVQAITFDICALTTGTDGASPANNVAPAPQISGSNLRRLQRDCLLELFVGAGIKKPQVGVPFSYINQSVGAYPYASGGIAFHGGTGGMLSARNQKLLKLPVYIGGFGEHARAGNSMHFHVRFRNADGGAVTGLSQDVRLRIILDGLKKRPA